MIDYKISGGNLDEGEKPFWISYSDLMTALMILFLVVMVASLTSISQEAIKIKHKMAEIKEQVTSEKKIDLKLKSIDENKIVISKDKMEEINRLVEIKKICEELKNSVIKKNISANVDCVNNTIDLGEGGRFDPGSYTLNDTFKVNLGKVVKNVIALAESATGSKWLKVVHVRGFTDSDGSYLYNLNLSLKRSEWVMCQIVNDEPSISGLSESDRALAKKIFMISGVSFNDQLNSKEASRRVEFKLEFKPSHEPEQTMKTVVANDLISTAHETCPI